MRYLEIRGGLNIPVTNEEQELLERIEASEGHIPRKDLNEREREVARIMVSKGHLNRYRREDQIVFEVNDLDDLWRS
jgi:hypothetical protein